MIYTIQYAREYKVPFFGICLGMQCATIEYARDMANLKQADSTEFDPQTPNRVIYNCASFWAWTKWAARCAWAHGRAGWSPAHSRTRLTARLKSANATATVTSSIANTRRS